MKNFVAVYPGQGSQHPGMGRFLFENFKDASLLFEEASDAIQINMKKLCFEASEEELTLTFNAQPALLTVSVALDRILKNSLGFKPLAYAGHSAGEYAAVVSAGALKFADAVKAVRLRGQAMQEAVPVGVGGMAAVMGAEPNQVKNICQWAEVTSGFGVLQPANFNAPGQIVISGSKKTLDWLQANYSPEKVEGGPSRFKMIPLKVSAPFHCSMMKPAEETMAEFLAGVPFSTALQPVVQNVSAEPTIEGATLRQNLIQQITAPVRWHEGMLILKKLGGHRLVEVGSGKVLSGLAKKIDGEHWIPFNINSLDELKNFETQLVTL